MTAGGRNRKVTIERYGVVGTDDYGGAVVDWALLAAPMAKVIFGTGTERREAAQESATAPATFQILHTDTTASVTPKDRIIFDGSTWDIVGNVPSLKLNRTREITAVRKVA